MLCQPFPHFSSRCSLDRLLHPHQQPHRRRRRVILGLCFLPHQIAQLVAHDLHILLVGRELQQNLRAKRLRPHMRNKLIGHAPPPHAHPPTPTSLPPTPPPPHPL